MDHADTSGTVSGAGIAEFTARLRRATRDLVADAANRDDRTAIADATRPIVAAVRNELRDWRHEGASGPQVAAAWVRMVDTAVREAYHMARFQSGQTGIVAPLAVVAVGAYGGQDLRPDRPVQLLLVVPADRRELSGRRMARCLTQNLRAFGLSVSPIVTTTADHAHGDGRSTVSLTTGRVLAGSASLWMGHTAAQSN